MEGHDANTLLPAHCAHKECSLTRRTVRQRSTGAGSTTAAITAFGTSISRSRSVGANVRAMQTTKASTKNQADDSLRTCSGALCPVSSAFAPAQHDQMLSIRVACTGPDAPWSRVLRQSTALYAQSESRCGRQAGHSLVKPGQPGAQTSQRSARTQRRVVWAVSGTPAVVSGKFPNS